MKTSIILETKIEGENIEASIGDDKQIKWLIEGMLPKGHRGMIANCEGGCKTTLLCWIAVRVALGLNVFSMGVEQGPVLMIDEETPKQSLEMKIYRFCLDAGLESRHKIKHLEVRSCCGFRFARANTEVIELIKEMKPALITIDTLLACLPSGRQGKGENNAETGIAVRDDLNRIQQASPDSAILMAAHSAKPIMYFEIEDYRAAEMQALVRGHGSIVGEACDTGFGVTKLSQYPDPLRFAIIPKARREAIPMKETFVEMVEDSYGKGKARLIKIPPVIPIPSKPAIDIFSLFMDGQEEWGVRDIYQKAQGLYMPQEIRLGLEQLRRRKVIVATKDHFTFTLNPKDREQANPKYVEQLLEGQHTV
ncbi:AAA family ATPase [Chloroflexota bacterium]